MRKQKMGANFGFSKKSKRHAVCSSFSKQ